MSPVAIFVSDDTAYPAADFIHDFLAHPFLVRCTQIAEYSWFKA